LGAAALVIEIAVGLSDRPLGLQEVRKWRPWW
jgi:hypothetical protein